MQKGPAVLPASTLSRRQGGQGAWREPTSEAVRSQGALSRRWGSTGPVGPTWGPSAVSAQHTCAQRTNGQDGRALGTGTRRGGPLRGEACHLGICVREANGEDTLGGACPVCSVVFVFEEPNPTAPGRAPRPPPGARGAGVRGEASPGVEAASAPTQLPTRTSRITPLKAGGVAATPPAPSLQPPAQAGEAGEQRPVRERAREKTRPGQQLRQLPTVHAAPRPCLQGGQTTRLS